MTTRDQPADAFVDGDDFDLFDVGDENAELSQVTDAHIAEIQANFGQLLDMMPAGFVVHMEQAMLYANDQACRILRTDPRLVKGRHILDFLPDSERAMLTGMFFETLNAGKVHRSRSVQLVGDHGHDRFIEISMAPLQWKDLRLIQVLMHDITKLELQKRELRRLATVDALTGVFNRRHFIEIAEVAAEAHVCGGPAYGLLVLDIDHFKAINDVHGHQVGDDALQVFARGVEEVLRGRGTLGRVGGEEFAILIPDAASVPPLDLAEEVRSGIAALTLSGKDNRLLRLTASIGVAIARTGDTSVDDAYARADEALYRAKNGGRNRVDLG